MHGLFAQGFARNPQNESAEGEVLLLVGVVGVGLIIYICFLISLTKTLLYCRPSNRAMQPGQVWLNIIPCFSIIWLFVTVNRVAQSVREEFHSRGRTISGDGGQGVGLAMCLLNISSAVPRVRLIMPIPALICFLIYWIKIAGYNRILSRPFAEDEERADRWEEDYEDDERDDRVEDRGGRPDERL